MAVGRRWIEAESSAPPLHVVWHQVQGRHSIRQTEPVSDNQLAQDDRILAWILPDDVVTHRLKSTVFSCFPEERPVAFSQPHLQRLCSYADRLEHIVIRIAGDDAPSSRVLDLQPLRQLRHLRVMHLRLERRHIEPAMKLSLRQLLRPPSGAAAPDASGSSSSSSSSSSSTALLRPSQASWSPVCISPTIEELTIELLLQWQRPRAMRMDAELAGELAAAFPRLQSLHVVNPVVLQFPLGGVFPHLRHFFWHTNGMEHTVETLADLLRALLHETPLLESLRFRVHLLERRSTYMAQTLLPLVDSHRRYDR